MDVRSSLCCCQRVDLSTRPPDRLGRAVLEGCLLTCLCGGTETTELWIKGNRQSGDWTWQQLKDSGKGVVVCQCCCPVANEKTCPQNMSTRHALLFLSYEERPMLLVLAPTSNSKTPRPRRWYESFRFFRFGLSDWVRVSDECEPPEGLD